MDKPRLLNPFDSSGKPRRGLTNYKERIATQDLLERQNSAIQKIRMERLTGSQTFTPPGSTEGEIKQTPLAPDNRTEAQRIAPPRITPEGISERVAAAGRAAVATETANATTDREGRDKLRSMTDALYAKFDKQAEAKGMEERVASGGSAAIKDELARIQSKYAERIRPDFVGPPNPDATKPLAKDLSRIAESRKELRELLAEVAPAKPSDPAAQTKPAETPGPPTPKVSDATRISSARAELGAATTTRHSGRRGYTDPNAAERRRVDAANRGVTNPYYVQFENPLKAFANRFRMEQRKEKGDTPLRSAWLGAGSAIASLGRNLVQTN